MQATSIKILQLDKHAHIACVQNEVSNAEAELQDRRARQLLSSALATGAATGSAGAMKLSSIMVAELEAAVTLSEKIDKHSRSLQTEALLQTAHAIYSLRQAQQASDWEKIDAALKQLEVVRVRYSLPPHCESEGNAAQLALKEKEMHDLLHGALISGQATWGEAGVLDSKALTLTELDTAIGEVKSRGGPTSVRCKVLLQTARVVRQLRAGILAQEWAPVRQRLAHLQDSGVKISECATSEVEVVVEAAHANLVQQELMKALRKGPVRVNSSGYIDALAIEIDSLTSALELAVAQQYKTEQLVRLIQTAQVILTIREEVKAENWAEAERGLQAIKYATLLFDCWVQFILTFCYYFILAAGIWKRKKNWTQK